MDRAPLKSSNVRSAGYDPAKKELEIEFSTGVYRFFEVPESVYDGFIGSGSKGSFFAANIKGKFPHQRMT